MPRIQVGVSLQFYYILFQNCVPVFNEEVYGNAVIKKVSIIPGNRQYPHLGLTCIIV